MSGSLTLPDDVSPAAIDDAHGTPKRTHMEATAVVAVRAETGFNPHDGILITGEVAKKEVRETVFVDELDDTTGYDVLVDVVVRVQEGVDEHHRAKEKVDDKLEVIVTDDDAVEYAEHHDTEVDGRA